MIPIDMTILHNPEKNIYGDCFRCCVASILDLYAKDVPHFMELGEASGEIWYPNLLKFLKPMRLSYLEIQSETRNWLNWEEFSKVGFTPYYILSGRSPRADHSVVAQCDKIIHDPHPSRLGLIGPLEKDKVYHLGFFVYYDSIELPEFE